jgi:sulfonate transport system substrate-binding protein
VIDRFKRKLFKRIAATGLLAAFSLTASAAEPYKPQVLRIGYQKYGTLVLLKARGDLEKRLAPLGVKVEWTEFTGGVRLLEGLNLGAIDFGTTGDAPPVFAQAAGAPLLYVGYEPPTPGGIAFVVKKDAPFQSVKDLKGKRVSVNKGGNVHYLLLRALEANQLKPSDVEVVYLPAADARPAFERGAIDAWVVWDPFLAHAEHTANARVIQDGTGLSNNYQFYFASRALAQQRQEVVDAVLDEIRRVDAYAKANIATVAEQLAPEVGMDRAIIETALKRMGYGVQPLTPEVLASQQRVADTFFQAGLIPKPVKVSEAVWSRRPDSARSASR